jgi:hypothetical protein
MGTRDDAADITTESSEGLAANPILGKPLGLVARVKHFWHEIAVEMKKVSWSSRSSSSPPTFSPRILSSHTSFRASNGGRRSSSASLGAAPRDRD